MNIKMLSSAAFLGVVTGNGHKVAALLHATIFFFFFSFSSVISMGFPGGSKSKESVISLLFHTGCNGSLVFVSGVQKLD